MVDETYRIKGENAVGAAFNSILRDSKRTADRMAGFFKTAFAGVSLLTFGQAIKQAIDRADEIGTLAKSFGTTAEELSRLDYVAKQSNTSLEQVTAGLTALQKNLALASEDSGRARKAIAALGISAADLARQPLPRQLELIAQAFEDIHNPAQRVRIAAQLFGDEVGRRMLPVLELGIDGIRRLGIESDRFGNTLTAAAVEKLKQADEASKRFNAAMTGLKTNLATLVTPAVETLGNALAKIASPDPAFGIRLIEDHLIRIGRVAKSLGITVEELLGPGSEALRRYHALSAQIQHFYDIRPDRGHHLVLEELGETAQETEERLKALAGARRELLALGDPLQQLEAKFLSQKERLEELAEKYPQLAGSARAMIRDITTEYTISVDEAIAALDQLQRKADIVAMDYSGNVERRFRSMGLTESAARNEEAILNQALGYEEMADNANGIAQRMHEIREESGGFADEVARSVTETDELESSASDLMKTLKDEGVRRAFSTLSDLIYGMGDGMDDFAKSAIDAFRRILSDYAAQQIIALFSGTSSGGRRGGGFLGGLFGRGGGGSGGGLGLPPGSIPTVPPLVRAGAIAPAVQRTNKVEVTQHFHIAADADVSRYRTLAAEIKEDTIGTMTELIRGGAFA